ncbi:hypothetical protein WH91_13775 [Devosia psychrophila]|uniref:Uncharacterized protein n=1 Tax=Devosia psychrophila TaxID=728005 RepID=A0A0F5PX14_9HYPH|nr:hypothetical protein [Devosia psychrophila]KKC32374.1 hypothetical protein WH91_13775 [Devosia psychrophila]SFC15631.1 hypothetical protein SAMN04488059_102319 [Devosia psychrophila]
MFQYDGRITRTGEGRFLDMQILAFDHDGIGGYEVAAGKDYEVARHQASGVDLDQTAAPQRLMARRCSKACTVRERWLGRCEQGEEWIFCLTAASMAANRRDHFPREESRRCGGVLILGFLVLAKSCRGLPIRA